MILNTKGQSYANVSKYCDAKMIPESFLIPDVIQFQLYNWKNKIINEITFKWRTECVIGGFRGYDGEIIRSTKRMVDVVLPDFPSNKMLLFMQM